MGFIKTDRLKDVLQSISGLVDKQVLVGIPDSTAGRKDEGAPLSNAEIGYIQENGAPEINLPARPHLVPGVAAAQPKTLPQLQKGVEAALDGDLDGAKRRMSMAGLAAQSSVRALINSGIGPALSDATLRNRARRGRKGAKEELASREAGQQPSTELAKPLVDTAQYRNSITYVLRKRK
ncbi:MULTISPECIES: hypothetical protein [Cupriavidus]|uniref:Bacteriophage protein n=1 Tax=Cupriavidus pauculus TaxID=82633 RepID=A0A3G8H069_9BURK|nr:MULTISPECIES: hypothetical protein [Cupriavidus]AZG13848.1 hypothetical protein EHF44_10540 [Cupriavidus pauculus]MDT6960146.1 hypothetical protein [Cupriavidus sp. SZY C1]